MVCIKDLQGTRNHKFPKTGPKTRPGSGHVLKNISGRVLRFRSGPGWGIFYLGISYIFLKI